MSWERQKSTVSAMPEEPSLSLWLMLGIVSLVGSVLLFVLHANKLAGFLMGYNIWIITACPLLVWFFSFAYVAGFITTPVTNISLNQMKQNMRSSNGQRGPAVISRSCIAG